MPRANSLQREGSLGGASPAGVAAGLQRRAGHREAVTRSATTVRTPCLSGQKYKIALLQCQPRPCGKEDTLRL